MSSLHAAVDQFLHLLDTVQNMDELQAGMNAVLPHIQQATPEELTEQLRRFVRGVSVPIDPGARIMVGAAALTCGVMVENGGDPSVCGDILLDRLEELLRELKEFWDLVRARARVAISPRNAKDVAGKFFSEVMAVNQAAAYAYYGHYPLLLSVVAHLSKSKQLRATARGRSQFLELAPNVDVVISEHQHLGCLLRVLDDEPLLVLHPGERKGFQTRMTAVADVLQLDTLCAARLIGGPAAGLLVGKKPDPVIISTATDGKVREDLTVASVFHLWQWQALRPDGSLPTGARSPYLFPWNAFPDEIPAFEGMRVLLLGPRSEPANWPATRRYRDMPGDLVVERPLSTEETADWLARLAAR
jgi:hypothetical protein